MLASTRKFLNQRRFHVTFMLFLGFFNLYSLRVNLSVAIIAMTEGTKSGYEAEFDWNSKQQGVILSSFFYGYLLTLFGGGVLASKIGGVRLYGLGVLLTAILTLLTPWAATTSFGLLIFVRAVEGIFGGVCYPAMYAIWAKWAPPMERSRLNATAIAGMFTGTIIMMPVSGVLAENLGWQSVFYVTGGMGCAWYILWILWISESPETDKLITLEERYVLESLAQQSHSERKVSTPWTAIFTSGPVWAICMANFAEDWGLYILLTQLPIYLSQMLDINLESNGLIAALPHVAYILAVFPVSYFADWTRRRGYLSTTAVRKLLLCSGQTGEAAFMIMAAYLAHPIYSTLCLIFGATLGSFAASSFAVNALDIAPQYSSIIMGLSNSFGTLTGVINPTLTGFIVQNKKFSEWSVVFIIAAIIYLISSVTYFFLGSGEQQSWAKNEDSNKLNERRNTTEIRLKEVENLE